MEECLFMLFIPAVKIISMPINVRRITVDNVFATSFRNSYFKRLTFNRLLKKSLISPEWL